MLFGKVCVASNASSIPEIAGDLVDYHDPTDIDGYVTILERAILDSEWREAREARIRAEYRAHAWSETSEAILGQARALLGQPALEPNTT
jgi:glycosyltransferase involved in cell wall biosynthesis